jgi:large subunit ribosomal protein L37e
MGKGTPSKGKKNKAASHRTCRRCGKHSFHRRKRYCAYCGFGKTAKRRSPSWRNRIPAFNGTKSFYRGARKAKA